jgi:hypothetical protein
LGSFRRELSAAFSAPLLGVRDNCLIFSLIDEIQPLSKMLLYNNILKKLTVKFLTNRRPQIWIRDTPAARGTP